MNSLFVVLRELAGLFIDDGSLALEILGIVVLAGVSSFLLPDMPLAAGSILLFGCVGTLFVNVTTMGRPR